MRLDKLQRCILTANLRDAWLKIMGLITAVIKRLSN